MRDMGAYCTSNALLNLWKIANKHMNTEQAAWFANIPDFARYEAENVATTLEALANLTAIVDEDDQPTRKEIAGILCNASSQVSGLAALIEIADDATALFDFLQKTTASSAEGSDKSKTEAEG